LLFIVSGASFISKKIKEQGFLRKSHPKHTPWIQDPRSGIRKNSSRIRIPDPGGKKHRLPDPGSATLAGIYFVQILRQCHTGTVWYVIMTIEVENSKCYSTGRFSILRMID
jgi:hypothetical protein